MARELDEPVDKATGEHQPEREAVEKEHGTRPHGEDEQAPDIDEARADDFVARNVTMSNAFPGGASPYAGALIGRTEKFVEPTTEEERLAAEGRTAESTVPRVGPADDEAPDEGPTDPRSR